MSELVTEATAHKVVTSEAVFVTRQSLNSTSALEVVELLSGSLLTIEVPGLHTLVLHAAVQNTLLVGGLTDGHNVPALVAYSFAARQVLWIWDDLIPDTPPPDPDDIVDEALPDLYSVAPSPDGVFLLLRLGYPTSAFFDTLITVDGKGVTRSLNARNALTSDLHDDGDRSYGWVNASTLLYVPPNGDAYTIDVATLSRSSADLPELVGYDSAYGTGLPAVAVIVGENGLAVLDLAANTLTRVVAGPCAIQVGPPERE
ncbi:MAG: hypothetical protein ACE5F5_12140 [Acidimicrobiia bacterium]